MVSGFSGKHYKSLDSKGRLIVPAQFREILSANHTSKLIITNDVFDKCLCAYLVEEWQKLLEKVNGMPQANVAIKYYMRRVIGSAAECEIDKQGRILIAPALRQDAGLNSEVVVLGLGNRIEVWDKDTHSDMADPSKVDREAFEEKFSEFGL